MKILIADDDRSFTQLLSLFLKTKGYSVTIAYDAVQTVASALRAPPDEIVLDILMPGGSGLDALRRLKSSTRTNRIPIVVVTASTDPQAPEAAKKLGADAFVPKPVDFEQLYRILSQLLPAADRPPAPPAARAPAPGGREPAIPLRERPAILDTLQAELSRAQREAHPIGVIMAVIDNFRRLNKVHGQAAAEVLFEEVAHRLRRCLRPYDSVGRWEEGTFLVVVPGCGETAAMKKARKLRDAISESPIKTAEGAVAVTLSLGVAGTGNAKETSSELVLRAAEEALKLAKAAGGSRVELAWS